MQLLFMPVTLHAQQEPVALSALKCKTIDRVKTVAPLTIVSRYYSPGACSAVQLPHLVLNRRCRHVGAHAAQASNEACTSEETTLGRAEAKRTFLTLPTVLTLLRVAAIPALVAVWYSATSWSPLACTALFVGASLTDFLDGFLARKMNVTSAFGAFLDPVADKLMVATVLILLCTRPVPSGVAAGNCWLIPCLTCLIIGREITMSALREWAAALGPEAHAAVAVSWVGKWKTSFQMVSITLLLAAQQGGAGGLCALSAGAAAAADAAGLPLLVAATALTVLSLAQYFGGLWRFMV